MSLVVAGHPLRLDGPRRRSMLSVLPGVAVVMLHAAIFDLPRADLIDALDADRYRIYWIIGASLLGGATGMAMTSFWSARLGLKKTFAAGLLSFSLGALLCTFATSAEQMAPWRLLSGYGMGLVLCAGMLVLWRDFGIDEELAMTLYGMGLYLSALLGVILGGLLLARIGWQALFLMEAPLSAGAAALAAALLPADSAARSRATRFDVIGLGLLTGWVVCLIPVVVLGHYWGWLDSPFFVPWGFGFAVASVAFVAWGTLAARPLVDLRPLVRRNFGLGLAVKAILSVNLFVLLSLLSNYMIGTRGYQWWQGGLVFTPALFAMGAAMFAGARFGRDPDRKLRIFIGLALMSAVTWKLSRVDLYTSKIWLGSWLSLWGAGAGLAIGPTLLTVFAGLPQDTLRQATGVFNIFRTLPVFAAGTLLGTLLTIQHDAHFDRLRLRITYDRPTIATTLTRLEDHFGRQGSSASRRHLQAHAALAHWVGVNAAAFALADVLRTLALLTASGLPLVPLLRPPSRRSELRRIGLRDS